MKKLAASNAIERSVLTARQLIRRYNSGERDFRNTNLDGIDLAGAALVGASFLGASMRATNLSGCRLTHVQLKCADLRGAILEHAFINASDLIGADFTGADLRRVDFTGAAMNSAKCTGADLRFAYFGNAILEKIDLRGARLTGVKLSHSKLSDTDLRPLCSAARLRHSSPSYIDARAVMKSYTHANLKTFMLDCGVPGIFAEYMIECARAIGEPFIQRLLQSTFISYGAPDERFASQLYKSLQEHGVTAFFFPETARAGERISDEIFRQIQAHDRMLLICSRGSLDRHGVINEIRHTLDREARDGAANYLLPIMLDDYVLTEWPKKEPTLAAQVTQRIIADFRQVKGRRFTTALSRVIDALKIQQPGEGVKL
jgi:uncharacterized protein YjbI with pentapeptide repeats